jgi:hypothetical protein
MQLWAQIKAPDLGERTFRLAILKKHGKARGWTPLSSPKKSQILPRANDR